MFRYLMTIIRELYLYLTKVIFMLKQSLKLRPYVYAALRHVATSPNVYKDVILPSVLK